MKPGFLFSVVLEVRMLRNPAKYFIRKDVQEILIRLTGCDVNKIFAPKFNPQSRQSRIELLTDEQLEQVLT